MEKNTDFDSLPRRELQALCKKHKIPANMTNVAMAEALKELYAAESSEENHQTQEAEESSMKVDPPASKSGRRATRSSKKASVAKEDVPEKEIDGIPLIELPDTPVPPTGRKTRSRGMAKTPASGKEERKEKIDLSRREDTAIPSRREAGKSRSRKVVSFAVSEEEGEGDQGLGKDARKQTPMAKRAQLEDRKEMSKSATTRRSARVRGGRGSKAVEKMADFSAVEELGGGKKIVVTEEEKRAGTEPELSDSVVTDEIDGRVEESSVPVVLEEKEGEKQSDSVVTSQTDVREEEKNAKNTEEQECIAVEAGPLDSLLSEADGGDQAEVTENDPRKEDDYNLEDQGGEEDQNTRGGKATFDELQPIAGDITIEGGGGIDEAPINGAFDELQPMAGDITAEGAGGIDEAPINDAATIRNLEEEKGDGEDQNARGGEAALQPIAGDITVEGAGGVIDEAPINDGASNRNLEEEKGDEEDQNASGGEAALAALQPIAGDEAPINGAFDELQPMAGDITAEGAGGIDEAPINDGASNRNLEEEKGDEEDQNARGGEAALAALQPIAGDLTVEGAGGVIDEAPINRNLEEEKVEDEEVTPVQTMQNCNGGSVIDEAPINVAGNRNLEEEKREYEEVTTAQPLQHSNGGGGNRNLEEKEREVTTAEPMQNSNGGDGSAGELKCKATPDVDDVESVVAVATLHATGEEEPIPLVKEYEPTSVPTVESNSPTPMMEGAPSPVAAQSNEEKGPLTDDVVVCDAGSFSPKMVEEDDPSSPDLLGLLFRSSPDGAQVTEEKGEGELLGSLFSYSSSLKVDDDVTKEEGEEGLLGALFSSSSSAPPKGAEEGKGEEEEEEESSDDAATESNDGKQICKPLKSEMTSSTDDDECNCGENNVGGGGGEVAVCVLPQMINEEEEEDDEEDPSSPDLLGALFSSPPKVVDEVVKDQEEEEEEGEEDHSSPVLLGALFSSPPKFVDEVVKDEEEEGEEDPSSPDLLGALFSSPPKFVDEAVKDQEEEEEEEEEPLLLPGAESAQVTTKEKAPSLSNCHVHEEGGKTTAVEELVIEKAAKVGTTAAAAISSSVASKSGVVESVSPSSRKRSVAKKKKPGNDDKENAGAGIMVLNSVVKMNTEVQQQQLERTTGKNNKQERLTVEEMNAMSLRQLRKQLQALNLADETPSRKKDEKKRRFALATLVDNSLKTPQQLKKH